MFPLTQVLGLATILATVYSLQCYGGMSLSNGQPNPNIAPINCLNYCRYKPCSPGDLLCITGEYKCGDNTCTPADLNNYNTNGRYCCNTALCTPPGAYGNQNPYQIGNGVSETGTNQENNGIPGSQNGPYHIGDGVSGNGVTEIIDPQRDNGISHYMYSLSAAMCIALYFTRMV